MSTPIDKLKKLKLFTDNPNLAIHQELVQLNDTMEKIAEKEMPEFPAFPVFPEMPETKFPEVQKVEIQGAEVVTIKGDIGPEPSDERLRELITRLIPEPIKGDSGYSPVKGKDYRDGIDALPAPTIDEILAQIPPPKEGKTPQKNVDYFDGTSFDPETLQEQIDILKQELEKFIEDKVKSSRPLFGGSGKTKIILVDLSSQLDGNTKTFSIGFTHFGIISVQGSSAPFGAFRPTIDYTEIGSTIVFDASIDAAVSLATGQSLIVKVLK